MKQAVRKTGNDVTRHKIRQNTKRRSLRTLSLCVCVCVLNIELSCGRARQGTTDNVAERERRSDFTPLLLSKVYLNRKTEKKDVKSLGDTRFHSESQSDASTKSRKHLDKTFFSVVDLKKTHSF